MRRSPLRVAVLAAALGLFGAVAPAATASTGAPSGPLLFENPAGYIVASYPVSGTVSPVIDGEWPSASRDGRSMAFARPSEGPDFRRDLMVLDRSSGAVRTLVTRPGLYSGQSSWSPDGRQIAFDSVDDGGRGLSVVEVASGRVRTLTTSAATEYDGDPSWSPDGSRIAFTRRSGEVNRIYTVRPDGSGLRLLTTGSRPDFSPTGDQVLFLRRTDAVHVVGRDGGAGRRLFALAGAADYAVDAAWSPDGRRVAVQQPAYDDPNVCDCTRIRIYEPATARSWWGTPELHGGAQTSSVWSPRPR